MTKICYSVRVLTYICKKIFVRLQIAEWILCRCSEAISPPSINYYPLLQFNRIFIFKFIFVLLRLFKLVYLINSNSDLVNFVLASSIRLVMYVVASFSIFKIFSLIVD